MNQRAFCDSVVADLMRYAPYQEIKFDDMVYISEQLEQLEDVTELALAVLKINKHTKTGSLSFLFTWKLIRAVKERNTPLVRALLRSRDWPEVFDNPDLTEGEIEGIEAVSAQEKNAVEDTFYTSLSREKVNQVLFPTPTTRREVVQGKTKTVYENCMELCINRVAPDYLSNVIPVEKRKSTSIKVETCYSFWSVLEHLYELETTGRPKLDLSKDESKIMRELLDIEYKVYRFAQTRFCA